MSGNQNPVSEVMPGHSRFSDIVHIIVIALIGKLVLESFLVQAFLIQSNSMEGFLKAGDRILVNRIYSEFSNVCRGDIVLLNSPDQKGLIIKRVIALPNENIVVERDEVRINGQKLKEDYLSFSTREEITDTGKFKMSGGDRQFRIPDGYYFVMGDNRSCSKDSRSFGAISRQSIIGKAMMIIFPPSRLMVI